MVSLNVAIIAHDSKKQLAAQFCTAYSNVLSKHKIYATGTTGRVVEEVAGIPVIRLLPGAQGGAEQIAARIQCGEIDVLIFFRDQLNAKPSEPSDAELLRLCDSYHVPFATNIATAEVLIMALDRGDLDWRAYAGGHQLI